MKWVFPLLLSLFLFGCSTTSQEIETVAITALSDTTSASPTIFSILTTKQHTDNEWCVTVEQGASLVSMTIARENPKSPWYDKKYFYNQKTCQRDKYREVRGN